jgi:hypothetical protein
MSERQEEQGPAPRRVPLLRAPRAEAVQKKLVDRCKVPEATQQEGFSFTRAAVEGLGDTAGLKGLILAKEPDAVVTGTLVQLVNRVLLLYGADDEVIGDLGGGDAGGGDGETQANGRGGDEGREKTPVEPTGRDPAAMRRAGGGGGGGGGDEQAALWDAVSNKVRACCSRLSLRVQVLRAVGSPKPSWRSQGAARAELALVLRVGRMSWRSAVTLLYVRHELALVLRPHEDRSPC